MVRNLVVAGVVAAIMAGFVLVYTFFAPPQQPPMAGQGTPQQPGMTGGPGTQAQPPMGGQATAPQGGAMGGQSQAGAAPMGGGMAAGQGQMQMPMMCPCMRMMMGGGMMGGQMGSTGQQQSGTAGQSGQTGTGSPSAAPPSSSGPVTSEDQARQRAENYLRSLGNPNLKVGNVRATRATYEVQVVTKDNSEVNSIIVDKQTGQLRTQY